MGEVLFYLVNSICSESVTLTVCELMGRVRNVVLIECTLGLGKPKKGRDSGWEGTLAGNE